MWLITKAVIPLIILLNLCIWQMNQPLSQSEYQIRLKNQSTNQPHKIQHLTVPIKNSSPQQSRSCPCEIPNHWCNHKEISSLITDLNLCKYGCKLFWWFSQSVYGLQNDIRSHSPTHTPAAEAKQPTEEELQEQVMPDWLCVCRQSILNLNFKSIWVFYLITRFNQSFISFLSFARLHWFVFRSWQILLK